jgi:hypothetical protein
MAGAGPRADGGRGPEGGARRQTGAGFVAGTLTLDIPDVEARDMKPHPAARPVEMLDQRLGCGHELAAAVARLPGAWAPQARGKGAEGKRPSASFFPNQETKEGRFHGRPPRDQFLAVWVHESHHVAKHMPGGLAGIFGYQRLSVR